jgi:ubiquinone/menaquinone biosynthesis C-methylase UbiE
MVEYQNPNFPADTFAGTAGYYARFRLPYPSALIEQLLEERRGASREESLLDLACGPGRLTIPLAPFFRDVVAVDLEPEMIEQARQDALRSGVTNVLWRVGKVEDLGVPGQSLGMITIGEAFHRVDQRRVLENGRRWLRPGGTFVVLGGTSNFEPALPWHRAVTDVVRKWTGLENAPYVSTNFIAETVKQCEDQMNDRGFENVASHRFPVRHTWTKESIVGYLFSTSFCSRRALGDNADAFAADMAESLSRIGSSFEDEWIFGCTIGQNPQR